MATYTDNYNLKKPTYAEPANVKDINENMDMVDDIMHSSQVSLADAYDLNSTYNTGDKVMYEMLMYKCKEDGVTGAWDASKWERTTAVEGSGGADLDIYGEASGTAEASFSDGAEASLVKCIVEIEATQSGSGTPSPSNIRPISGHTDVTVTVASTSGGSGEDTTVSLGRTVHGGTLDVTTGVLTVTHGRVDLGSLSWSLVGSGNSERFQTNGLTDNLLPPNNSTPFSGLCEIYEVARWDYLESAGHDIFICNNSTSHWLAVRNTNYTSATDFTNSVNGKYLVYELATPQTYNLTPTQVKTLLGQNYVSHDGGGTISLVYIKKDSTIIPNPTGAEIPLTGLEINGEKFKIVPETEDISEMEWTLLDSTTSTGTSTLIPEGTKYLALVVDFSVSASIVAIESIKNIIKTMDITSKSVWNVGYEWCDTAGNHTYVAMSGDATHVQAYSGYNTVTAKVYAVS